jgi:hypothetical protein
MNLTDVTDQLREQDPAANVAFDATGPTGRRLLAQARRRQYRTRRPTRRRQPARRRQLANGRLIPVLAGLATLVVASLLVLPSGSGPAIAGWTTQPDMLDGEERAEFDALCRSMVDTEDPEARSLGHLRMITDDSDLVIADRRGQITIGIYVEPDGRISVCDVRDDDEELPPSVGGFTAYGAPDGRPIPPEQEGTFEVVHEPGFRAGTGAAGLGVYGRLDPDIDTLRVQLDDGRTLDATIEGGHFMGWWPTRCTGHYASGNCSPALEAIEAIDADGNLVDRKVRDTNGPDLVPDPQARDATPPR